MRAPPKTRLDQRVVELGLADSREKAQRLILAGQVRVAGQIATKPGREVLLDALIDVAARERFVGRGGEKLEKAFETFSLDVRDKICLDVGASTGGFTDCLLQHGAAHVYAVDVGTAQLHWRLRQDPRVTIMENVNARYLKPNDFPTPPAVATADVSFISLTKILPAVNDTLTPRATLITLIKPQFEAGRADVEEGGVVRDAQVRECVIDAIRQFGVNTLGWSWKGLCESPIRGPAGKIEYLAWWQKP